MLALLGILALQEMAVMQQHLALCLQRQELIQDLLEMVVLLD
jgi:hypothetical protein